MRCPNSYPDAVAAAGGLPLLCNENCPDEIVEAYEHESGLILGTQFHPERLTGSYWDDRTPNRNTYFAYFVHLVQNEKNKAPGKPKT